MPPWVLVTQSRIPENLPELCSRIQLVLGNSLLLTGLAFRICEAGRGLAQVWARRPPPPHPHPRASAALWPSEPSRPCFSPVSGSSPAGGELIPARPRPQGASTGLWTVSFKLCLLGSERFPLTRTRSVLAF